MDVDLDAVGHLDLEREDDAVEQAVAAIGLVALAVLGGGDRHLCLASDGGRPLGALRGAHMHARSGRLEGKGARPRILRVLLEPLLEVGVHHFSRLRERGWQSRR